MEKSRIVVELFLERPNFKNASSVAKALKSEGIKTILMPPKDRKISTHLVIEKADLAKARKKLEELKIKANEKEVIIIPMENRPGTMAKAVSKISSKGINLIYAFSVTMTPKISYALLGAEDNNAALKALG